MRILASNPDTVGDMVLRQPMYHALLQAGHDLTLIVRPSVAPLIDYIAPGTSRILLPMEVYRDDLEQHASLFGDVFRAARDLRPQALLVAPFQWTQFEERLSDELKDIPVRRFGMSGRLYDGEPDVGRSPTSRLIFDVTANVPEDLPEIEKNAALTEAVLGHRAAGMLAEPRIEPDEATLEEARGVLGQLGMVPGNYWVACVAGTIRVPIKAWPLENWARLLSHWVGRHGRRFLFVGLPEERQIVDGVRKLMGVAADRTHVWMEDGAALSRLIGLTALSSGYAGHETDPMHLAAALGKPVLAVFGGGDKLRFVPRRAGGAPSVVVTVGVPCTGCAWVCPFMISHCVKDVPVERVIDAADDLEAGRIAGPEPRVLPPDDMLRDRMIREAAAFARGQLDRNGERDRQLRERQEKIREKQAEADQFLAELVLRTREAEELRRSVAAKELTAERLRHHVSQLELAAVKIALVTPVPSGLSRGREDRRNQPDSGGGPVPRASPTHAYLSAGIAAVRQTIESVRAQEFPRLEFILAPVGATGSELPWVGPYLSRAIRMSDASAGPFDAIGRAFDASDADVMGWLEPGDLLEPGALQNVCEFFRDHPNSAGAVFDDTTQLGEWRLPGPRPRLDAQTLLTEARAGRVPSASVFIRRAAYRAIGRFKTTQGRATAWDFLIRFARLHGFDRAGTHFACRRSHPAESLLLPLHLWQTPGQSPAEARDAWRKDIEAARSEFESTYGAPGRLRGWLIHYSLVLQDSLRRLLGGERLVFAFDSPGQRASTVFPAPVAAGEPRAPEEANGISPLTRRRPVRLIFRGPGADGGRAGAIFHDPSADLAYTYNGPDPQSPGQPSIWPFAEHRSVYIWERHLIRLPCPRSSLSSECGSRNEAARILSVLAGTAPPRNRGVCFLHAGCGDGSLLRQLSREVCWSLAGAECRPLEAAAAGASGFAIWEADPFDAATRLPIGQAFDVIFLDERTPRAGDLVTTLGRLRQLLKPRGHILLTGPNLDSRLLDLFGPTWPEWNIDRPLTVPGRRGVFRLACLADLQLKRFRTFTDVNACVLAVQQNRLRRVASSPSDPPTLADQRRGGRLAAWATLLWNWRGKGETFYAVLD